MLEEEEEEEEVVVVGEEEVVFTRENRGGIRSGGSRPHVCVGVSVNLHESDNDRRCRRAVRFCRG